MKHLPVIIILCLSLAGCPAAYVDGRPNPDSPYYQIPVGSRLILEAPVQIPAGQNEVYFQGGRLLGWSAVNIYMPYCGLKVTAKQPEARTIRPDHFVVREVHTEHFFNIVSNEERLKIRPAALVIGMAGADLDRDGGSAYEVVGTVLELASARQPDVTTMICTDWGFPQNASYITVSKIRKALGGFFKLELNTTAR